jgi:hypothetical protein
VAKYYDFDRDFLLGELVRDQAPQRATRCARRPASSRRTFGRNH